MKTSLHSIELKD